MTGKSQMYRQHMLSNLCDVKTIYRDYHAEKDDL